MYINLWNTNMLPINAPKIPPLNPGIYSLPEAPAYTLY